MTAPVLLFSDLISAPRAGWSTGEPNKGAAITLHGFNFGSFSAGNTYVTVGGVDITAASDLPEWGVDGKNPHLDKITFYLNSTVPTGSQTVTVTTRDGTSSSVSIKVTTGSIKFADANATGGTGTLADPWEDPVDFTSTALPGDVLYCRTGTFNSKIDGGIATWYIRNSSLSNDGTATDPIGICAYPLEAPVVDAPNAGTQYRGIVCAAAYYTFSGLRVTAVGAGIDAGYTASSDPGNRVIGCDVTGVQSLDSAGHIVLSGSYHVALGNKCHGGRSGNKQDHAIYISGDAGDGGDTVAWNYTVDNDFDTGPMIVVNHQDARIPPSKFCKSHYIYGNFIDSTDYPAIGIGVYDQSWDGGGETEPEPTYVYNNFLTGCGVDRTFPAMSQFAAHAEWYNNHVHNCKGAGMEFANSRVISGKAKNNIFELTEDDTVGGWDYIREISLVGATITLDNNLYIGSDGNGTDPLVADTNGYDNVDPETIVDLTTASYTIRNGVYKIGAQSTDITTIVTADYNGFTRPASYSVGALDYPGILADFVDTVTTNELPILEATGNQQYGDVQFTVDVTNVTGGDPDIYTGVMIGGQGLYQPTPTTRTLYKPFATSAGTPPEDRYCDTALLLRLNNGDMFTTFRRGSSHVGNDGRIFCSTSSDEGVTWGSEVLVHDSATGFDTRNQSGGVDPVSGRIVIFISLADYDVTGNRQDVGFVTSTDNGATWSTFTSLITEFPAAEQIDKNVVPFGPMVETTNGLMQFFYYHEDAWVLFSTDGGQTWGNRVDVWTGSSPVNSIGEPSVIPVDTSRLVAVIRDNVNANSYKYVKSSDGGATWSAVSDPHPWTATTVLAPAPFIGIVDRGQVLGCITGREPDWELHSTRTGIEAFWDRPWLAWSTENVPRQDALHTTTTTISIDWGYTSILPIEGAPETALISFYDEDGVAGDTSIFMRTFPAV